MHICACLLFFSSNAFKQIFCLWLYFLVAVCLKALLRRSESFSFPPSKLSGRLERKTSNVLLHQMQMLIVEFLFSSKKLLSIIKAPRSLQRFSAKKAFFIDRAKHFSLFSLHEQNFFQLLWKLSRQDNAKHYQQRQTIHGHRLNCLHPRNTEKPTSKQCFAFLRSTARKT